MHFVPAFGLVVVWLLAEGKRRTTVLGFTAVYCAFTVYVFVEALIGKPFLGGLL
jgi:hypothetical protein